MVERKSNIPIWLLTVKQLLTFDNVIKLIPSSVSGNLLYLNIKENTTITKNLMIGLSKY